LFNRGGDYLAAKLRPGNAHSAEDWEELLLPEIERQQKAVFRADAAFAKPEIYEALEQRGVKNAIRIPSNDSLERDIAEPLKRPVGRPSYKPVPVRRLPVPGHGLEDGAADCHPTGGDG
jgi:Transposase DDE domain group 1